MMFGEMGRGSKTTLAELAIVTGAVATGDLVIGAVTTGGGVGSLRFSIDCVTERGRVAVVLLSD